MLNSMSRESHMTELGKSLFLSCLFFATLFRLCCMIFSLLLKVLRVLAFWRNAILSLYTKISVFSCGIGDGSFLFWVLCGVETGCPLSSLLFFLVLIPALT